MISAALAWALMPGVPLSCGVDGAAAHVAELAGAPKGTAEFLRVVAWQESRCRTSAVGDAGRAVGAFQLHASAAGGRGPKALRKALRACRGVRVFGAWVAAAYVVRLRAYIERRCKARPTWDQTRRAWRRPELACVNTPEAQAVSRRFRHAKRRTRHG